MPTAHHGMDAKNLRQRQNAGNIPMDATGKRERQVRPTDNGVRAVLSSGRSEYLSGYTVREIPKKDTHDLILNVHYAKRMPPIMFAFGLFLEDRLKGIVTYGMPVSRTLCSGVCGEKWKSNVIELNRLVLVDNQQNEASRLVSGSLKLIPGPRVVVSYADSSQDHVGYVYQATNFLYTGSTTPRTDIAVIGLEHMHSKAICNMVRNDPRPEHEALKAMFGDRLIRRPRSVKHRYVYFIGNRKERKELKQDLRYAIQQYPKK